MPPDYSNKPTDQLLDLDDTSGELGDQVQQVRAELESLRQKQEEIEREKNRLEELKRRQDELDSGRSEMLEKLTRAMGIIQREIEEGQQRVEQMRNTFNAFTQHLRQLEGINARSWGAGELPRELSKALSAVEDARIEYTRAQVRIGFEPAAGEPAAHSAGDGDYAVYDDRNFSYWFKAGLAFTIPLQVAAILGLALWTWSILSAAK